MSVPVAPNIVTPPTRYLAPPYGPFPFGVSLQSGIVGTAYSQTISVQGGTSPYTFAVTSGSLPASTSLNTSTGVISGTPTVAATSTFTITVTDAKKTIGSHAFSVVVSAGGGGAGGSFAFIG